MKKTLILRVENQRIGKDCENRDSLEIRTTWQPYPSVLLGTPSRLDGWVLLVYLQRLATPPPLPPVFNLPFPRLSNPPKRPFVAHRSALHSSATRPRSVP